MSKEGGREMSASSGILVSGGDGFVVLMLTADFLMMNADTESTTV